jgi:hypothetical protein
MPFPISPYSANFLVSIQRTVTHERLQRYLTATGANVPHALMLYELNVALSETMYGLLHGLEVSVRNAMDYRLKDSYVRDDWYEVAPLTPYWRDQVNNAKDKVRDAAGVALPGKVIAELTFGFWVDLTGNRYNNPLWLGQRLSAAFPNTTKPRQEIHTRLKEVQRLRNRISHHERILTSRNRLYNGSRVFLTLDEVLECIHWVCADTADWLRRRFRYAAAQGILNRIVSIGGVRL